MYAAYRGLLAPDPQSRLDIEAFIVYIAIKDLRISYDYLLLHNWRDFRIVGHFLELGIEISSVDW